MKNKQEKSKKRKSRFPIARIKRIMQSDEEIGKVSTSAPVVLSKAVELFMCELISKSVEGVRKNKVNRLVLGDVEKVIHESSKFDFLKVVLSRFEKDEE